MKTPITTTPQSLNQPSPEQQRLAKKIDEETRGLWHLVNNGKPAVKNYEKLSMRVLHRMVAGFYGIDDRIRTMHKSVTAAGAIANRVFNTGQALLRFYEHRELARYTATKQFVDAIEARLSMDGPDRKAFWAEVQPFIDASGFPDRDAFIAAVLEAGEELFREAKMDEASRPTNAEDRLANYITQLVHANAQKVGDNLFSNIDEQSMTALIQHMETKGETVEEICEKLKLSDAQYAELKRRIDAQKTTTPESKEQSQEARDRSEDGAREGQEQPDAGDPGTTVPDGPVGAVS